MSMIRNRIKAHVRVKAGSLVPHELNPRRHTDEQRAVLAAIYEDVGFARSLLAYELPDGRLKLIDGHLRAAMDPEQEVDVEVLDVNDAEARALILSIDPLAQLASYDAATLENLRRITTTDQDALHNLWQGIADAAAATEAALARARDEDAKNQDLPEQYLVLVECADEPSQAALLARLSAEGFNCKSLMS
jgi:hypothetical protein